MIDYCKEDPFFQCIIHELLYNASIKLCNRCQRNTSQLKSPVVELNPIPVEPKIWHLVGMDLIGPFKKN